MTEQGAVFCAETLKDLLAEARDYVLSHGVRRDSARGSTYSVRALTLTWKNPSLSIENHWSWQPEPAAWYQRVFVEPREENKPERLAEPGDLLFPYTYAARSRLWDGGWGYVSAVLQVCQSLQKTSQEIFQDESSFLGFLSIAAERVHLQVLLAVLKWLGRRNFQALLQNPHLVDCFIQRTRIDQLERIITEVQTNPGSRRAVTVSFVYSQLDQCLRPLLGIPPYQFFQLLPGEIIDPLDSFHVHRSLDAGQGVQLDFMHDYAWLNQAAGSCGREIGSITITAGDFHVYLPSDHAPAVDNIEKWLLAVTDGYPACQGIAKSLLEKENYLQNALSIFKQLGDEQ